MNCAHIAAETAEKQTSGLEAMNHVIALVSEVMILAGIFFPG
jgi:hypothetical protein